MSAEASPRTPSVQAEASVRGVDTSGGLADLVSTAVARLKEDHRVRAIFLAGAFGRSAEDRYSDVDLLVLVDDAVVDVFFAEWTVLVGDLWPFVHTYYVEDGCRVVAAIDGDWRRLDIAVEGACESTTKPRQPVRRLFDPQDLGHRFRISDGRVPRPRTDLPALCNEFCRVSGLLVASIQRHELVAAESRVLALKNICIEVFLVLNDDRRGPARRLNEQLSRRQVLTLSAWPPITPSRNDLIDGISRAWEVFVESMTRDPLETQVVWPPSFLDATARYLDAELGTATAGLLEV
jgi:hypothetical protein